MKSFKLSKANEPVDPNTTKKCHECLKEIPIQARKCSYCGTKQKTQNVVATIIIVIGMIVMFTAIFGGDNDSSPSPSSTRSESSSSSRQQESNIDQLELLSFNCYKEYGYFHIDGEVKNISGKPLENVAVLGSIYTEDGTFVKSSEALLEYNPILPDQTSPFSTLTTDNPAATNCKVSFKNLLGGSIKHR